MDDLNAATRTLRYTKAAEHASGDPHLLHMAWLGFAVTVCMGWVLFHNLAPKHRFSLGKGKTALSASSSKARSIKPLECKPLPKVHEERKRRNAPVQGILRQAAPEKQPQEAALEKQAVTFLPNTLRTLEEPTTGAVSTHTVSLHELHDAHAEESSHENWDSEPRCADHASWMKGADHGLTPTRNLVLPASAVSFYGYSLSRGPNGCSILQVPWSIPTAPTAKSLVPLGKSPSLTAKAEMKTTAMQYLEDLGFDCPPAEELEEWQEPCSCNGDACISCLRRLVDSPKAQPAKQKLRTEKATSEDKLVSQRKAAKAAAAAAYVKRHSLARHNHDQLKSFLGASC